MGGTIYASKKVFVLDLDGDDEQETLLSEGPDMNAGKSNHLVIAAQGKIYVLACSLRYDLNVGSLGPLPYRGPDYGTEIYTELNTIFEVFDPKSGIWTVLPGPPDISEYGFDKIIIGHAVVHDKILLSPSGEAMYSFDLKTQEWEVLGCYDEEREAIRDYDHALLDVCIGNGFMGRGLVIDDTLYALNAYRGESVRAYHISNNRHDLSFPFGVVEGLGSELSSRRESSGGGVTPEGDLVHLGDDKFCLVSSGSTFDYYQKRDNGGGSKRDITFTIF